MEKIPTTSKMKCSATCTLPYTIYRGQVRPKGRPCNLTATGADGLCGPHRKLAERKRITDLLKPETQYDMLRAEMRVIIAALGAAHRRGDDSAYSAMERIAKRSIDLGHTYSEQEWAVFGGQE